MISSLALVSSAQPALSPPPLSEPGILLTFDDTHVAQWVEALPLFAKYNARVTFFVTRFDQLSEEQIAGLKKLEAAGHTIGCHGLRHIKAAEYTAEHGIENYLATEITPALDAMEKAGFRPSSFAYPSSNNDAETDAALLKLFRHLRTGAAPKEGQRYAEMAALFTPLDQLAERGCLIGKGIDRIGKSGNEDRLAQLFDAMTRAANNNECLTLYAHNIADDSKSHHVSQATLEKILQKGQELGLRFYAFNDLP